MTYDLQKHLRHDHSHLVVHSSVRVGYGCVFLGPAVTTRGAFDLDLNSGELTKYGTRIRLQEQPFQVLKMLLERPGEVVTRDELRLNLWPADTFVDFNHGLNNAVNRLREVLCDSAESPKFIETIPRRGYRLIAPVEQIPPPAPHSRDTAVASAAPYSEPAHVPVAEPQVVNPEWAVRPVSSIQAQRGGRSRAAIVLAMSLILLVALVSAGALWLRAPSPAIRVQSLAVLPLENVSGDPGQEYFVDGMTDALITNLAGLKSVRVISRTSAMHYKGSRKPLPEIARELGVDAVVEGTVWKVGDRVRLNAQLIDAAKDQHLWARQYDGDLQDVLQLQSDLASEIAREVAVKLSPQQESRLAAKSRRVNPQAYDAYLRGEYFLDKWTAEGFRKAKGYFEQSIELDPAYADGYAGLAEYYGTVAFLSIVPAREAWLKSEDLLAKALQLDDSSSKAHSLLGMLKLQFGCDRAAAERELNYALELNPGDMRALDYHSYYLLEVGRTDEAITDKRRVLEHDPLRVISNAELGLYLLHAGRTDEAIAQLQKTLELDPDYAAAHMRLGMAYSQKQQYGQAVTEFQKAISLDRKPARLAHLAEVYALWGKRNEALEMVRQLKGISKQEYVAPGWNALIYARLGERENAFRWLEKAKPEDDPKISDLGFESLRSDPRFKMMEARLKPDQSCPAV